MTQLEAVLTDLNTALRVFDLDRISANSAMLETIISAKDPDTLRHIARLARLARENMALAEASIRGIKAASRRLAELRTGGTLSTYDQTGRRTERALAPPDAKRI